MNAGGVPKVCKSNDPTEFTQWDSGERVRYAWATCPEVGNSSPKGGVISNSFHFAYALWNKDLSLRDGPACYQLVGEVIAHQG